jgi:exonuclease 3'-5' domain-containing protein 1
MIGEALTLCLVAMIEQIHKNNQTHLWLKRPLGDVFLSYAASDIRMIAHLFSTFVERGIIPTDDGQLDELLRASAQYVSRGGQRARLRRATRTAPFQLYNLLMRNAVVVPLGTKLYNCTQCGINAPAVCFESQGGMQRGECRVCVAGDLKSFMMRKKLQKTWVQVEGG